MEVTMPKPRFFSIEEITAMESVPGAYTYGSTEQRPRTVDEWLEEISRLKTVIEAREKELKSCVNELCHRCGRCENEHLGACRDCRWLPIRNGGMKRDAGADATS